MIMNYALIQRIFIIVLYTFVIALYLNTYWYSTQIFLPSLLFGVNTVVLSVIPVFFIGEAGALREPRVTRSEE